MNDADAVVIGGGFFGCAAALLLKERLDGRVVLVEQEQRLLGRASYVNQARVHGGYHYPRARVTAARSRVNFPRWTAEFSDCVTRDFSMVYAIARGGNVSASQFSAFCGSIGAECVPARPRIARMFNDSLVEGVFEVVEHAFDAAKLAARMEKALAAAGVEVLLGCRARVHAERGEVVLPGRTLRARWVVNATYAGLAQTGVPLSARLKHEICEVALVTPPPELGDLGVTVMDGQFWSCMPFPAAALHSLTHVRYTPHQSWLEGEEPPPGVRHGRLIVEPDSHASRMVRDAARFMPALARAKVQRSLFDIKTLLVANESDDGRPIMVDRSPVNPNVLSVLGGKVDNIYDCADALDAILRQG